MGVKEHNDLRAGKSSLDLNDLDEYIVVTGEDS